MYLSNKANYWANRTIIHDKKSKMSYVYFINRELKEKNIDESSIDQIINIYLSTFCNHYINTSHFIKFINSNRLASFDKKPFYHNLLLYIKQFYNTSELFDSSINEND